MEELAEAEFRHADTQKLKSALIDVFAHHSAGGFGEDSGRASEADRTELVAELDRLGFARCSAASSARSPRCRSGARSRKRRGTTFY